MHCRINDIYFPLPPIPQPFIIPSQLANVRRKQKIHSNSGTVGFPFTPQSHRNDIIAHVGWVEDSVGPIACATAPPALEVPSRRPGAAPIITGVARPDASVATPHGSHIAPRWVPHQQPSSPGTGSGARAWSGRRSPPGATSATSQAMGAFIQTNKSKRQFRWRATDPSNTY